MQMNHSRNVTQVDDHMVIWGIGGGYAWLSCPVKEIPFGVYTIEVEASADTADGRWPELAVALNDSGRIVKKTTVRSLDWVVLSMGEFVRTTTDSLIFFSFTNDYRNRETGGDLNLKVKTVTFRPVKIDTFTTEDSIMVLWDPNDEPDLAGYRVHYRTYRRSYSKGIDVKDTTGFRPILAPDSVYYFAVSAYDTAGNSSEYSVEVRFFLSSTLTVSSDCDINGDSEQNARDWFAFQASFGAKRGDSNFRSTADFDNNGLIDEADEQALKQHCYANWGLTNK